MNLFFYIDGIKGKHITLEQLRRETRLPISYLRNQILFWDRIKIDEKTEVRRG